VVLNVEDSHISLVLNHVKGNFGIMTLDRSSRSSKNFLTTKNECEHNTFDRGLSNVVV
jgi:hypothetical protein